MTIDANSKIGLIIKSNPEALEAIISINSKFIKLRNPILRKVIASRTSILTASKIAGCSVDDFFNKLRPLGFTINNNILLEENSEEIIPEFFKNLREKNIIELNVIPIIETGKDPLTVILSKVKEVQKGDVLKIINSFVPIPLIELLKKKGFESYVEEINENMCFTYFHKLDSSLKQSDFEINNKPNDWDEILNKFFNKIKYIDVRNLEMPKPMFTILEELNTISDDVLLFVHHKKVPVFLLPELDEKNFDYRFKEVAENHVDMLIFKK